MAAAFMSNAILFFTHLEGTEPDNVEYVGVIPEDAEAQYILYEMKVYDGESADENKVLIHRDVIVDLTAGLGVRYAQEGEIEKLHKLQNAEPEIEDENQF